MTNELTPKQLGYRFPAEWEPHEATWLSWPHKEASWPGKIDAIYPQYALFVNTLAKNEKVNILVSSLEIQRQAKEILALGNPTFTNIYFHLIPTNDAWCRDHGPAFLIRENLHQPKAIVDWGYNAWGNKYPPFDLDDVVPEKIAQILDLPCFFPNIIMEGGSVEFNGHGTLLTSKSCLLNPNRNPNLNQAKIESYLYNYYGQHQVLWVDYGIEGDDTDGHIDDTIRFVSEDTVVCVVEENIHDENFQPLQDNLKQLSELRLLSGKQINIIEIPMPAPVIYEDQRLPASYANFYIANGSVIVPTYQDHINDQKAVDRIQACFPDRNIVAIDSTDIIWGLGSFHCLSQQEPLTPILK